MKKKFFKIATVLLSAVAICTVFSISITSNSQGNDPLVTLSYLTEIILPQMKQDIMAEVEKNSILAETDIVTDTPEVPDDKTETEDENESTDSTEIKPETEQKAEDTSDAEAAS